MVVSEEVSAEVVSAEVVSTGVVSTVEALTGEVSTEVLRVVSTMKVSKVLSMEVVLED